MANGDLLCRSPGALSMNAIKVGASGSLAGGLITGVSNMSATSTDSSRLLKAGVSEFNSDGTPRASMTPRASSYMVPPESPRVERSTDSQNRQSLLGVQSMSVEASGGSLLSPGTSKKVNALRHLLHFLCQLKWITCGCLPEVGYQSSMVVVAYIHIAASIWLHTISAIYREQQGSRSPPRVSRRRLS